MSEQALEPDTRQKRLLFGGILALSVSLVVLFMLGMTRSGYFSHPTLDLTTTLQSTKYIDSSALGPKASQKVDNSNISSVNLVSHPNSTIREAFLRHWKVVVVVVVLMILSTASIVGVYFYQSEIQDAIAQPQVELEQELEKPSWPEHITEEAKTITIPQEEDGLIWLWIVLAFYGLNAIVAILVWVFVRSALGGTLTGIKKVFMFVFGFVFLQFIWYLVFTLSSRLVKNILTNLDAHVTRCAPLKVFLKVVVGTVVVLVMTISWLLCPIYMLLDRQNLGIKDRLGHIGVYWQFIFGRKCEDDVLNIDF